VQVTAIIAAGGRGARFGREVPKQLVLVGGRAILDRSVAAFRDHPAVHEVVVALPPDMLADPPPYLRTGARAPRLVGGGPRRQDSVANAFEAADPSSELILIHDAARPFASADLIARTIELGAETGAALAALGASDTVKRVIRPVKGEFAEPWLVGATLPREEIFLAQTPQVFHRQVLAEAIAMAGSLGIHATDEATLVAQTGHPVWLVRGEPSNVKITTPEDLAAADAIARATDGKPARTGRAGTGYDLHRLEAGRPLIVGGVTIPSDRGPVGHSDADVACHAITDAILGAAGLGDIGQHFPDSDPRWKGASSLDLLSRAVMLAAERGFVVGNVDVTVVLEAPKIRQHIDAMRTKVAGAIGLDPSLVSIKGKTNEGVDAVGRGEAIAAHAVALLRRA
jgi:2-C-methyl-D-erythritol 4-phosphate cytidylyltransferase / 2-C-methyl-D-erythritol 2,4-cyclodiphosphate synthase